MGAEVSVGARKFYLDYNRMSKIDTKKLKNIAKDIRKNIFKTICSGGGGHIPASLSIVELLVFLYHNILNIDPDNPAKEDRDRFILSKGHSCVALYNILAEKGFFPEAELDKFGKKDTILGGHPDMHRIPGVEASTGSLGHGLSFGMGMALAGKLDKKDFRVFVLLGDGECQEGSVWEAAMFASQNRLDNLIAVIDYNKIQAMDYLDKIVSVDPLADKWRAFGWGVKEADGHSFADLNKAFSRVPFVKNKPSMLIAHTTKGKGISFMENSPIWHYRFPNKEELKIACEELGLGNYYEEL